MASIQFSGLATGIDSASLIDAIIEARETANVARREEIDYLESESDSLEELNTKLLNLYDLVDRFRTVNGGGVSKKATSSSTSVATAAASASSANASYSLTVTSLADTATGSIYHGTTTYTSTTSIFDSTATGTGQISILVGTGGDQVTVTATGIGATTTLQEVVDQINADSDANGRLVASAVNIGTSASPNYKLVLASQDAGTALGTIATSFSGLAGAIAYDNTDPATNAVFSIAGINGSITRTSNTVSDVISGMTFQLISAGSTNLVVSNDSDATADAMTEIVEAYNDIVDYINENDLITRDSDQSGASPIYGSLAKTQVDDDFLSQFQTEFLNAASTNGTYVTAFSEMGLSTNRDGTLTFDETEFKTAMGNDSIGVGEVLNDFADSVGGITGMVYQFTKYQGYIDVALDANADEIDNINDAIEQLERRMTKLRENLEGQFSRLEAVTAELQQRQSSLTAILSSL